MPHLVLASNGICQYSCYEYECCKSFKTVEIISEIWYNFFGFRGKHHRPVVLPTSFDTGYESRKARPHENRQVQLVACLISITDTIPYRVNLSSTQQNNCVIKSIMVMGLRAKLALLVK